MKALNQMQRGFAPVIIVAAIFAVGILGLIGYSVYNQFFAADMMRVEQSAIAEDMEVITSSIPVEVVDTNDLDEALLSLEQITATETNNDIELITIQVNEF